MNDPDRSHELYRQKFAHHDPWHQMITITTSMYKSQSEVEVGRMLGQAVRNRSKTCKSEQLATLHMAPEKTTQTSRHNKMTQRRKIWIREDTSKATEPAEEDWVNSQNSTAEAKLSYFHPDQYTWSCILVCSGQLSTVRGVKTESSKPSIIQLQKFPQLLFAVNRASLMYLESQKPFLRCGWARNRS